MLNENSRTICMWIIFNEPFRLCMGILCYEHPWYVSYADLYTYFHFYGVIQTFAFLIHANLYFLILTIMRTNYSHIELFSPLNRWSCKVLYTILPGWHGEGKFVSYIVILLFQLTCWVLKMCNRTEQDKS